MRCMPALRAWARAWKPRLRVVRRSAAPQQPCRLWPSSCVREYHTGGGTRQGQQGSAAREAHAPSQAPTVESSARIRFECTPTLALGDWCEARGGRAWLLELREEFHEHGFVVVRDLLDTEEVDAYAALYDVLMSDAVDTRKHRHDLGSNEAPEQEGTENICQIMWPSAYVGPGFVEAPLHSRAHCIASTLLGDGTAFDFDMLIAKAPRTNTAVPWHSDEGYWPDMPDKRAASCWVAMDDATVDNGCMWFVPRSNTQPLRAHRPAAPGSHVLAVDGVAEDDGVPVPLSRGSCTFHSGRTLHYSRGNSTDGIRRALITNYRPSAMVAYEREAGFDHGLDAGIVPGQ